MWHRQYTTDGHLDFEIEPARYFSQFKFCFISAGNNRLSVTISYLYCSNRLRAVTHANTQKLCAAKTVTILVVSFLHVFKLDGVSSLVTHYPCANSTIRSNQPVSRLPLNIIVTSKPNRKFIDSRLSHKDLSVLSKFQFPSFNHYGVEAIEIFLDRELINYLLTNNTACRAATDKAR